MPVPHTIISFTTTELCVQQMNFVVIVECKITNSVFGKMQDLRLMWIQTVAISVVARHFRNVPTFLRNQCWAHNMKALHSFRNLAYSQTATLHNSEDHHQYLENLCNPYWSIPFYYSSNWTVTDLSKNGLNGCLPASWWTWRSWPKQNHGLFLSLTTAK